MTENEKKVYVILSDTIIDITIHDKNISIYDVNTAFGNVQKDLDRMISRKEMRE